MSPGSVTPLAIVNDTGCARDRRARHQAAGAREDQLPSARERRHDHAGSVDLLRFIRDTGHEPVLLDLDLTLIAAAGMRPLRIAVLSRWRR